MRGASARFFSLFYTTILAHCTKQTVPASCHDCRRQAVGINRSSAPKALSAVCLKGLNALKGFKDLSGPTQNRRPRPSGTPSNLEGDVHGAVHAISTTPPDLPYRRGGVLRGGPAYSWVSFLIPVPSQLLLP